MVGSSTDIKRFMAIFKGNLRSYGQFNPNKSKERSMQTIKESYSLQNFEDHLNGVMGLGIVPVRDDGMCLWGAIDIDNHGQTEDLDLLTIEHRVKSAELPLIVCRSKSGGAHLYLFGIEWLRADMVRTILTRWMADLKLEGSDCVFPKQSRLVMDSDGNRALGNWINLPYFGGNSTTRFAIENGRPISLDLFLTNVESMAITQEQLDGFFLNEHSEAPPCIQRAVKEPIEAGMGLRNEALFHITIYNRKRNPDQAREMSHEMQTRIFTSPISFSEADRTIRSAAKKNYGYLCKKEPWKQWCDKETCRKRKFGISETEFEILLADTKLPQFSDLIKYMNTEPVLWEIKMNGVPITLTTAELMDYNTMRQRAMESLHVILPSKIKPGQWTDEILAGLMENVIIEEAPLESSPIGVLGLRLGEFLRKCDLSSDGTNIKDREALLRGMPVVQIHQGDKVIMFRSIDYEDYLKKNKTDQPRNRALWHKLNKQLGVKFDRVRVKDQIVSIWFVDFNNIVEHKYDTINFTPEY